MELATLTNLNRTDKPYQVLDLDGQLVSDAPTIAPTRLVEMHRWMWLTRMFSDKIVALQRQGRATTFGPLNGQEASAVGIAAPLLAQDWLGGSYREVGSYMVKGIAPRAFIHGLRGYPLNELYSPEAHCLPFQIVIATQMLHMVGIAMAQKIKGSDAIAVGVCGDGASSEGDFNEALNFAGVFKAPAVLVVVNNGWAISVPRRLQSAAPTFAARGIGFGMPGVLVDGNDVLAVYKTMSEAAVRARAGDGPTLIECITYRTGAHTTADDPTRYVPREDVEYWKERDPIVRFRRYLFDRQLLDEAGEKEMVADIEAEINTAVQADEAETLPPPDAVFNYAFQELTPRLERQRGEMRRELEASEQQHQTRGTH